MIRDDAAAVLGVTYPVTPARWAILWSGVLRRWRRSIRSARERRIYRRVVLHAFRAERRFRVWDAVQHAA